MKIVKLFISGRFEDAYVYMGHLMAITEDRTLAIWNLDQIASSLDKRLRDSAPVFTLLFSRNDWLAGTQFRAFMSNRVMARELVSAIDRLPQPFVEINRDMFHESEQRLDIASTAILDMLLYNYRLYVGATDGMYHVDLDWAERAPVLRHRPKRRIDARCLRISAKYGSINASCGDDGLISAVDEFGVLNSEHAGRIRKHSERSLRAGWYSYDLVNYPGNTTPVLFTNSYERTSASVEGERTVVTEIGTQQLLLSDILRRLRMDYGVKPEGVQYVSNSDRTFFVNVLDGHFYTVGLTVADDIQPSVSFSRTYQGPGTRVLNVAGSRVGLVVETDDNVYLFSQSGWVPIAETEVISARTFMRSRRFQNIVALTVEDGIILVGLFDEAGLGLGKSADSEKGQERIGLAS